LAGARSVAGARSAATRPRDVSERAAAIGVVS
jgi:hypothetical protein